MKRAISFFIVCCLSFLILTGCGSSSVTTPFPHGIKVGMTADQVHSILGSPNETWTGDSITIETFYVDPQNRPEHFDTNGYIPSIGKDEINIDLKGSGNSAKVVGMVYRIPVSEDLEVGSADMNLINSVVEAYANYLTQFYGDYDSSVSYNNQVDFSWDNNMVNGKTSSIWLSGPFPNEETYYIEYNIITNIK